MDIRWGKAHPWWNFRCLMSSASSLMMPNPSIAIFFLAVLLFLGLSLGAPYSDDEVPYLPGMSQWSLLYRSPSLFSDQGIGVPRTRTLAGYSVANQQYGAALYYIFMVCCVDHSLYLNLLKLFPGVASAASFQYHHSLVKWYELAEFIMFSSLLIGHNDHRRTWNFEHVWSVCGKRTLLDHCECMFQFLFFSFHCQFSTVLL